MHVDRTPAGRWRVQVRYGGRRLSGTFDSQREATRRGAEMLVELGASPIASSATVGDIIADHCADLVDRRSPTYSTDMQSIADRLPTSVTGAQCEQATPAWVEAAYRKLAKDGWTPHRVRRAHELLHGSFKRAIRLGVISVNPMPSVQAPQIPDTDVRPPTKEQTTAILAAPDRLLDRLALRLSATTGARRGEVVALQWADIDGDRLGIKRSLAYTPASGVHIRPTKTGRRGQRVITIDDATLRDLREWRSAQAQMALAAGVTPEWIVSDDAGLSPWRPDRLTVLYARAAKLAGVEGHRLHDLRHFNATQLLTAGVDVRIVSYRLGHASISTTMTRYAHWIPGTDSEAADIAGRLIG